MHVNSLFISLQWTETLPAFCGSFLCDRNEQTNMIAEAIEISQGISSSKIALDLIIEKNGFGSVIRVSLSTTAGHSLIGLHPTGSRECPKSIQHLQGVQD
jgi:hypothetical protein